MIKYLFQTFNILHVQVHFRVTVIFFECEECMRVKFCAYFVLLPSHVCESWYHLHCVLSSVFFYMQRCGSTGIITIFCILGL